MGDSKPINPNLDETSNLQDRPPQYTPRAIDSQNYGYNPPPGYQPYPVQVPPTAMPNYGATTVYYAEPRDIIVIGGCPACRVGVLEDDFSCLGVCCAILFFPIGILCCLALKQKRCSNCNAQFG